MIFSSRDIYSLDSDHTLQLSRIALVCKTFVDPALDILWGDRWIDLRNLFHCFPADVVESGHSLKTLVIDSSFFPSELDTHGIIRSPYLPNAGCRCKNGKESNPTHDVLNLCACLHFKGNVIYRVITLRAPPS
ncbi:hypothetical protein HWV62_4395 [Athelia sp. TMB]|nr:hypothetical protein HWV62_4395 [Athelia sp. TMB]